MMRWLFGLGLLLLFPYLYVVHLQDLRAHTVAFEIAFYAAFGLYAGATLLVLQLKSFSRRALVGVFALAVAMQAILLFTRPTLSDDMYRYVWDGRVQAIGAGDGRGWSPYRYPPDAPELVPIRDKEIWPEINRNSSVTVYPALAEMTFYLLWRIWPDNVTWFQIVMAAGGLLAGGLLVGVLKELGRSPARVLIYLWSPLLAFETAHAAHLDGLVLPLLVGAWWARLRQRDALTGVLLGLGTAMKIYPLLLFPALWRPNHKAGRWRMPVAFLATLAVSYLPYLITSGPQVIGFLPKYLRQLFNESPLVRLLYSFFNRVDFDPREGVSLVMLGALGVIGLWMVLHPAPDGETAIRRSVWLIGAFTLFSQNLFAWYMLWLLPLLAIFLKAGHSGEHTRFSLPRLRMNAWTGWWLFCGLIPLSYTFFITWHRVPAAIWIQYLPLYAFLLADFLRLLWEWRGRSPVLQKLAGMVTR